LDESGSSFIAFCIARLPRRIVCSSIERVRPRVDGKRKRVERLSMVHFPLGLIKASHEIQEVGVELVGGGVARVEFDGSFEFFSAPFQSQSYWNITTPSDVCASASLLSISSAFSAAFLAFGKASIGGMIREVPDGIGVRYSV